MRAAVEADYAKADAEHTRLFMWTNLRYYTPMQLGRWKLQQTFLENQGGPFVPMASDSAASAVAPPPASATTKLTA